MKRLIDLLVAAVLFVSLGSHAATEQRVALVIGNAAYKQGELSNPVNDARAMASQLRSQGFDVVLHENLKSRDIGSVYRQFRNKITPGGVALVFYAGHGIQFKGQNYFPAVDSNIASEEDVPLQSLHLGTLLDNMEEAKAGVSLVLLDACRDNPFARRFRSATRGLAKVEAASGTLIHYATKPGSVASDGEGQNGTYTEALLAQMSEPGVPVELMLKRVTNRVVVKTKGKQEPWVEGSLRGEFYFIFQGPSSIQLQPTATPRKTKAEREEELWDSIKDSDNVEVLNEYLKAYPKGHFVTQARILVTKLKAAPSAMLKSEPAANLERTDTPENTLWAAAEKGSSVDEYNAYLSQYPKGKYSALANIRIKKLQGDINKDALREKEAWEAADKSASEDGYQGYLKGWPGGRYAYLAQARLSKLQADLAARRERESKKKTQADENPQAIQTVFEPHPDGNKVVTSREELAAVNRIMVNVGSFSAAKPGENNISCRGAGLFGTFGVRAPYGEPFSEVVRKAFLDELKNSNSYSSNAATTLTGNLDSIDFSSVSGIWNLVLTVRSSNGKSLTVSENYPFTTSYDGQAACQKSSQALIPAIRSLIGKIVSAPEFPALAVQ